MRVWGVTQKWKSPRNPSSTSVALLPGSTTTEPTFLRTKPCSWHAFVLYSAPGSLLVRLFKEFLARLVLWLNEKLSLIQLESPSFPSMQSDCRLHSWSHPDQPPNIKLSKRPLDSIVTTEGPSKRSYVASSSKQHSESRVFPAVAPLFNALRTTVFAANKSTISPLPTNWSLYSAKNSITLQPFSSHIFPVLTTFNKSDPHFATLHLIRPRLFTFSCYHCFQSSRLNTSIPVLPTIHTPRSAGLFNTLYNPPISSQPTIHLPRRQPNHIPLIHFFSKTSPISGGKKSDIKEWPQVSSTPKC